MSEADQLQEETVLLRERVVKQTVKLAQLQDAVEYLRPRMTTYQGQRMCSQATWKEFERRVDGA